MPPDSQDERFLRRCLELADEAEAAGEVPVGAVVVRYGKIVGEGRARRFEIGERSLEQRVDPVVKPGVRPHDADPLALQAIRTEVVGQRPCRGLLRDLRFHAGDQPQVLLQLARGFRLVAGGVAGDHDHAVRGRLRAVVAAVEREGDRRGEEALHLVTGGDYTVPFWFWFVVPGLLVPIVFELLGRNRSRILALAAAVLVVFGGFMLRYLMVEIGQVSTWTEYATLFDPQLLQRLTP